MAVTAVIGCGGLTACATQEGKEAPLYKALPDSCAELVAPALRAIRQYAGELFDETVEYIGNDVSYRDQSAISCEATYTRLLDRPAMRLVAFKVTLDQGEDPVASSKVDFQAMRNISDGRPTSGLADESFDASEGSSSDSPDNWAITAFRRSNVSVRVRLRGENTNGEIGNWHDIPASELQPSAQAIAKAWADNLDSILTHQ